MAATNDDPAFAPVELVDEGEAGPAAESTRQLLVEVIAITLMVVLADLTIYRGHGFAGFAAFFATAPVLLLAGASRRRWCVWLLVIAVMLWLLSARLLWYGAPLQVASGIVLVAAFAAVLAGHAPLMHTVLAMASQSIISGLSAFAHYGQAFRRVGPRFERSGWLNVALPLAALFAFGTLFVLANPDAVTFLGRQLEWAIATVRDWLLQFAWRPTEILFWLLIACVTAGLLRPRAGLLPWQRYAKQSLPPAKPQPAPLYPAFRNTLVTVITLFALYLTLEFKTLWFRDFPDGFYYAGYAHEGAAWLTLALALATLVLSLIFTGRVYHDPRVTTLRRLAWVWSLQNLLLTLAVYHRLFIYIGFNGMTRMRIVGIFGISVVVVGFLLVVWKITYAKPFRWLMHRQLWALACVIYVFALAPVDRWAVSYNVHRILAGDPSASMQIGVQPIDTEGILALPPLLNCRDPQIREGVRALLADRYGKLRSLQGDRAQKGWTSYQLADHVALQRLDPLRRSWREYEDQAVRRRALRQFHDYAYQWY